MNLFPFASLHLLSILFTPIHSSPTLTPQQTGPTCTNITIPVTISSKNANIPQTTDFRTVINLLLSFVFDVNVSGAFSIAATYCEPEVYNASRANTLQFLNHGATYTRAYWFGNYGDPRYSWILSASLNGYPTLSIDRLGNGLSSHPDPFVTVQYPTEVQVAHQIVLAARSGSLAIPSPRSFSKILYIGHSYGSVIGNNLNAQYPTDADAIILTGFSSTVSAALPGVLIEAVTLPADIVDPTRFGGLSPGYLKIESISGFRNLFYGPDGSFDPAVEAHDFSARGTVSVGDAVTILFGTSVAASYKGPVHVMTGQHDAIFCNPGGLTLGAIGYQPQCISSSQNFLQKTASLYPNSRSYSYYVLPNSGHCWELHYEALAGFGAAHVWLAGQGF